MALNALAKILFFVLVSGDVTSGAMKPVTSARNSVTDFGPETNVNRISASEAEEVVVKLGEIADVLREGTQAVILQVFDTLEEVFNDQVATLRVTRFIVMVNMILVTRQVATKTLKQPLLL